MTYEVTYNMKQENKFPDKDYEYLYNKYWKNEEESPFAGTVHAINRAQRKHGKLKKCKHKLLDNSESIKLIEKENRLFTNVSAATAGLAAVLTIGLANTTIEDKNKRFNKKQGLGFTGGLAGAVYLSNRIIYNKIKKRQIKDGLRILVVDATYADGKTIRFQAVRFTESSLKDINLSELKQDLEAELRRELKNRDYSKVSEASSFFISEQVEISVLDQFF